MMDATERLNLDALREALGIVQREEFWTGTLLYLPERDAVAEVIEAARLVAEGQPVWWCEEHGQAEDTRPQHVGIGHPLHTRHCPVQYENDTRCRMVEVLLVKGAE